ncbi:type II toxin-antitoxin system RelE/ParE family toxin [Candidatus Pacearchaeota archaeon]|nr:type II toxin-antitoxin system RelE/ParE family toxin [Candidatus Pacearchaeota archaeon]
MVYELKFDKEFTRDFNKLDNSIQVEADKKLKQLKINPKEVGKPLKYFANLFELHVRMYRIFYVVEESQVKVLVLALEHKDNTDKYLRQLDKEDIKLKLSAL